MKNLIWCEVTCGCCGTAANSCGYYSPERIKKLKVETKDWVEDENYRVLCPACAAIVRAEKKKAEADKKYNEAIAATIASGKADQIINSDKAQRVMPNVVVPANTSELRRSERANMVPLVGEFGDLLALMQEDVVPDVISEEKE